MIPEPAQLIAPGQTSRPELRWVNPLEIEAWDDLVRTHPDSTIFHSRRWAEVLARSYGYTPHYLIAADAQRLWALLPLCEVRSWLTGTRGVSLPFTDCCAPLLSPGFSLDRLFESAREFGRSRRWKTLQLRGTPADFHTPSLRFYEHSVDLTQSEAVLSARCDSAMRRSIRRAEREGIRIQASAAPQAVETYYRLHQLTRKKHGLPPQPASFFRNIGQSIIQSGGGAVFLALRENLPVAGALFFHFGTHSVYKFGASDPRYQELRPNNLLMWQAMIRMKEKGAKTLSFGRTSIDQEGLRRFKSGFGSSEHLIYYIKYCYHSSDFVVESDHSSGLHAALFRHCPAPVARGVGTVLYPHIG